MSNKYYNVKWKEALNDLYLNLNLENEPRTENELVGMKYKRSQQEWFFYYGNLYIRYISAYRKLEDCYDQLTHPQKRMLLREMLNYTMLRLLQVQKDLIYHNQETLSIRSEFPNLDELLFDLKLNPLVLQVPVPRFPQEEFIQQREKRNQIIDKLLLEFHETNAPEEEVIEERIALQANRETAIRILQKNERGRQGIQRAMIAKQLRKLEFKKNLRTQKLQEGEDIQEETEREDAVMVIQKYYKGFKSREKVWNMREEEMYFLGINKKAEDPKDQNSEIYQLNQNREHQKQVQGEQEKAYSTAIDTMQEELRDYWSSDLKDQMLQERREWYMDELQQKEYKVGPGLAVDFYDRNDVKPPLTPEEEELQRILEEQEKKNQKKKSGGQKGKQAKQTEREEFLSERVALGPTETVQRIQEKVDAFNANWAKKPEVDNFEQNYDLEMIKQQVMPEIEEQMQVVVDQMIDMEILNLKLRYKYKNKKKKQKKKKKKQKKKKKKLPKVPGAKLCQNRDPRDMLAELIQSGIVKKLSPAVLSDFMGDFSVMKYTLEKSQEAPPDPSMFDLRNYLSEELFMKMGSQFLRDSKELDRPNYFHFFGPHGGGQSLVVRALATMLDCMVLDLSPSNLTEQHIKDKNAIAKMLYMTFTCAQEFQPAIIYIDEIELAFQGKKQKKKKGAPVVGGPNWAKLGKPLLQFRKAKYVKKEDRVAVISCTSEPWSVNKKQIKQFSDKKVFFPYPNYGTRQMLFEFFMQQKGVRIPHNFMLSSLCHLTEGYTAGNYREAINKVLTERRIMQLKERPLHISEFIAPLSNQPCAYKGETEQYRDYYDEMSGIKARRKQKLKPTDDDGDGKKKKQKKK